LARPSGLKHRLRPGRLLQLRDIGGPLFMSSSIVQSLADEKSIRQNECVPALFVLLVRVASLVCGECVHPHLFFSLFPAAAAATQWH
jgi:hypothetical protein